MRKAERKSEFHDGEIFQMAKASTADNITASFGT
jgi:hypothetical protein